MRQFDFKILIYIEPWIENANPSYKKDYIWWFGKIVTALETFKTGVTSIYFLIGDYPIHVIILI
jgi:hypothetical protein